MATKKTTKKNNKPERKLRRRLITLFWTAFIIGLIAVVGLFVGTSMGIFGEMPNVNELESPDIYVASEIISSDGVVLDKYEKEKRIPVTYQDLPPSLVNALVAKEDVRFYEHSGIDFRRTLSATAQMGSAGGASTITQQLAKLLFTGKRSSDIISRVTQKLKENIIAVRLERLYTKDEIIAMYLNKFDFTRGAYGIQMAAKIYFNKDVKDLNLSESATLVAMLQKPSGYNPVTKPEAATEGRDGVINQMANYNFITTHEAKEVKSEPLVVDYKPNRNTGSTFSSYYKYNLRKEIESYLADYENKTGKKYDLYKDGLKVSVTIDSRMQKYAEEAIRSHLTKVIQPNYTRRVRNYRNYPYSASMSQKFYDTLIMKSVRRTGRYQDLKNGGASEAEIMKNFNTPTRLEIFTWNKGVVDTLMSPMDSLKYHKTIAQAGFMAMENHSGQIKAWVGGVDWNFFKYDHVKQGRRQVGSTFKPIVYATAISELNYTPCVTISNGTYQKGSYRVPGRGGMISIRDGLAHSQNPVALRLIDATGVDRVITMARDLGVTSPLRRDNTIALGSGDITIYEMVGAYATFANYGTYTKPEIIWRIEDSKGKVIKENIPETREVMNELYAYTMLDIMQGVTTYGTAKRMRGMGIKGQVAGKTGTTDDNSDGWFIGITPQLSAGVWVGFQERYARNYADGARVAMPIWAKFMKNVYADKDLGYSFEEKFEMPIEVEENGGFDCEILMGGSGDEDLYSFQEILSGMDDEEDTGPVIIQPKDKNVNEKLNEQDTLGDLFLEEEMGE